jgi:hypothetical protein
MSEVFSSPQGSPTSPSLLKKMWRKLPIREVDEEENSKG